MSKTFDPYVTTLQDDDELLDSLESTKRPSSLRKHLKLPRNSVQKSFETPMNQGRHWEISDNDIDISSPQPVLQETKIVEDDYDEIEYCAPNTLGWLICFFFFVGVQVIQFTRFTISPPIRLRAS